MVLALSIDDNDASGHTGLAFLYLQQREYDKSIAEAMKAVTLDPGSYSVNYCYATVLEFAGRGQESLPLFEKVERLNPAGWPGLYFDYGRALMGVGRIQDATVQFKKAIDRAPNYLPPRVYLTAAYVMDGREK